MAALSTYFTVLPSQLLDPGYRSRGFGEVSTADLDGDGLADLFVTGLSFPPDDDTPQPGRVAAGNGRGGYVLAPQSVFPWQSLNTVHPREVVVADFNGDGRSDLFIAAHGWDASPYPGEQNRLFLSTPDGSWRDATATLQQRLDFSHSAAAADIDRDGDLDLYVGNIFSAMQVPPYILVNDGLGGFTIDATRLPTGPGQLLDLAVMKATTAAFADLDGDDYPDLILGNHGDLPTQLHSLVMWNRQGSFSADAVTELPFNAPFGSNSIHLDAQAADVNGDGLQDILLLSTSLSYTGWQVQILINDGDRGFVDETAARLAPGDTADGSPGRAWAKYLHVLDFNLDGAPDFVLAPWNGAIAPSTPLVWLNDGSGRFTTLKALDFVDPGYEWLINYTLTPFRSEQGWSFVAPTRAPEFFATVILATRPYPATASQLAEGQAGVVRTGGAASDTLAGSAGPDRMTGGGGDDRLNGGAGIDAAFYANTRSSCEVTVGSAGATVSGPEGTDTVVEIERLAFADSMWALDIRPGGNTFDAWALFNGGFDRAPTLDEISRWTSVRDGAADIVALAQAMLDFYAPTVSDEALVEHLYHTVAGRPPSSEESARYVELIAHGKYSQASLLAMAAQLELNTAEFASLIGQGIALDPGFFGL